MFCRILPGIEPMYVRRWPRISASSRTPPRLIRTNLRLGRPGDRLAERRLADAGRPDEAQDRRLQPVDALLHREVLDDALLDLLEAVVIGVEHLDGVGEVLADLALLAPRQAEQRVDVVAHDRRFGRHRRHHLAAS